MDRFVTEQGGDSDAPSTSTPPEKAQMRVRVVHHATTAAGLAATGKQKQEKTLKYHMQ